MPKYDASNIIEGMYYIAKNAWSTAGDWLSSTRGYWDPYYAGRHPIRYDDPQYKVNQIMAGVSPTYGALYRAGSEASFLSDYGSNRNWNGLVTYPGMSSYGGWQSLGSGTRIVSENITRLYRRGVCTRFIMALKIAWREFLLALKVDYHK